MQKYFLSLNPNVSTALHVFDHTIKPILPYGCEIWGSFSTSTARFRNGPFALDEIYSKSLCEKLHYTFCRFLLGVNCKSTKFAVLSELGRHPMSFSIIQHTLNYWHRLENLDDDTFPLLKAAYSTSVSNFNSNKTSWFGCIELFKQLLPQLNSFFKLSAPCFKYHCRCILNTYFIEKWHFRREQLNT